MNLEACPFCGGRDVEVYSLYAEVAHVKCLNCLASGPHRHAPDSDSRRAVDAWNKRKNPFAAQLYELKDEVDSARIRLYGALRLLVEEGIISNGRMCELLGASRSEIEGKMHGERD